MWGGVCRWTYDTIDAHWFGDSDPYWLTIVGPSETGKTHLAHRAVKAISDISRALRVPELGWKEKKAKSLTSSILEAGEIIEKQFAQRSWLRSWNHAHAIGVDDVGVDSSRNGTTRDILYRLFSERSAKGTVPARATIITTNLSPDEIAESYDPRLASRLRRGGNKIIQLPKDTAAFCDR